VVTGSIPCRIGGPVDRNLFLAFALSFAVLTGWTLLTTPPPKQPVPEGTKTDRGLDPGLDTEIDAAQDHSGEDHQVRPRETRPGLERPAPVVVKSPPPGVEEMVEEIAEETIVVEEPLYTARLTSRGAGIESWRLAKFRETADLDSPQVELVTGEDPNRTLMVTPLEELGLGDLSQRVFKVVEHDHGLVVFETTQRQITVRKTFTFQPDTYTFRVLIEVINDSPEVVSSQFGINLPAHVREGSDYRELGLAVMHEGSAKNKLLQSLGKGSFFGSLTGNGGPERFTKFAAPIDWAAVQTTYFLTAIVADNPNQAAVWMDATEPGKAATAELFFDEVQIPVGSSYARELKAYMGPKEIERLTAFGADLVRSINLGWKWVEPLTKFFATFLKGLYTLIPNYGVAIIILTILVRTVTAPLTMKQMRSMERMRKLSPKLKEIQAEHADDRAKQSEMTMALYKSEGVNPLGGCLPMLLQFPVFIGLFYALRSTIQLRQSPFFGWIDDLASPEMLFAIPGLGIPVRLLPLLMGCTMVLQQKITPMQADPAQAKMMMTVMPIMMTFVFYTFPSGLVLYWMVSNLLAISHQLWIGRSMRA